MHGQIAFNLSDFLLSYGLESFSTALPLKSPRVGRLLQSAYHLPAAEHGVSMSHHSDMFLLVKDSGCTRNDPFSPDCVKSFSLFVKKISYNLLKSLKN